MAQEIELKFQVPAARLPALRAELAGLGARALPLAARYFDTADDRLARGRAALRLRQEGEGWVQTLKAQGAQSWQRLEHNVPLAEPPAPGALPDLGRHDDDPAGGRLRDLLDGAALAERYRTAIQRSRCECVLAGARLELALDEGEIAAGLVGKGQAAQVCELEIELLEGPESALRLVAADWARRHGLWLDPRSKSARGQALAAAGRAARQGLPRPTLPLPRLAPVVGGPRDGAALQFTPAAWRQALATALELAAQLADDAADARPPTPAHRRQFQRTLRRLRLGLTEGLVGGSPGDRATWCHQLAGLAQQAGAALPQDAPGRDALAATLREADAQTLWLGLMGLASPAAVQLRPARPEDVPSLSVLAYQVFLDTYCHEGIRPEIARELRASLGEAAFEAALADAGTRLVVAEHLAPVMGRPVPHLLGFAQVTLAATHADLPPTQADAELLRLYVQEPFTGRQVGSALLAEAERLAAAEGTTRLWLTPWVHNRRACAFYARRGYADLGQTWFEFEGERHENRLLAKALGGA